MLVKNVKYKRKNKQCQYRGGDQSPDYHNGEWLGCFGTDAMRNGRRNKPDASHHCGHDYRPYPRDNSLADRIVEW